MTNGTDYRAILASDTPLIDVRAPVEFSQSAMPAAINLPLMNDEERAAVGTCYKRQGPEAALALGHKLVQGDLRASRTQAWLEACARYPHGYLCCARGGQRSHIVQQWLKEAGVDYPLIVGGYKALRQAAIQATDELVQKKRVDQRRRKTESAEDKGGILAAYGLSDEQGNEIIMAARAHWFDDEPAAADAAAPSEEAADAETSQ